MLPSSIWLRLLLAVSLLWTPVAAASESIYSTSDIKNGKALLALHNKALANVKARMAQSRGRKCNSKTLKVRQEWRTLSTPQKKNFIEAVKCVRSMPSLYPPGVVPGSKSLYDDFVAVHLNHTLFIHLTGTFLLWHRWYIQEYENRLHACGYTGVLPYWEWGLDVNDVTKSPVFDGSPTSLGGNGAYIPHLGLMMPQPIPPTIISTPPGTGSGCVTTGPFGNLTMRLGPASMPNYGNTNSTAAADPMADNYRCLRRDLNTAVLARYSNFYNSTTLLLNSRDVGRFQGMMQGDPRLVTGELGVHGGGHFTIGGDPGSDPFISPGDPAFWLHHGQVDRLYWIWQNLDWADRQNVMGTAVFMDLFPSANVTVNDTIDMTPLSPPIAIKDIMSTTDGKPLCYIYQPY